MTQSDGSFNLKAYLPVLATAYGEGANQPPEAQKEILSSILNRAESGKKEFGADTGSIINVLQTGYKSAQHQSPKYMEAMNQSFKNPEDENAFKQIVSIFSGMMKGTIPRTSSQFILTDKDLSDVKKNKLMNMDLLEKTSRQGDFNFFKYKESPSPVGRKSAGKKIATMR